MHKFKTIPAAIMLAVGVAVAVAVPGATTAIAGQQTNAAGQTATPSESVQRQLVTPPPGFNESCRRYFWFCENGGTSSLDQSELLIQARRINSQVNRAVREMTDAENYGAADYWTLPANGNGDCEDFVLQKYQLLLAAGADSRDLSIAVVLDRYGENHAVLVLRHELGDLVLDNLASGVRPWNETGYRFLAMQTSENKRQWEVVMNQPLDRNVLAQR